MNESLTHHVQTTILKGIIGMKYKLIVGNIPLTIS